MPDPDEQVYHQAADAMIGAQGYKMTARTRRELAAGWWRKAGFRAAVKVAYQAGYEQWRREHPLPVCDGGKVVMVTDLKAWMRGEVAGG